MTEQFLGNYQEFGLSGNCYILNLHFGQLLEALGYQVQLVRATGGNTHLALHVTVDGQSYYVDVGYGAPLLEPIVLEEHPRFTRFGEEVEIRRMAEDQYVIDRRTNGQSFVIKYIEWKPVPLESFDEVITHSLRDEDENPFMRRIVATLFKEDAAYSVMDQKLLIKTNAGTEVHEYSDRRDWMNMMASTFGFKPSVLEEALAFLAERGVHVFED